jgi:hypothetical protein
MYNALLRNGKLKVKPAIVGSRTISSLNMLNMIEENGDVK